MIGIVRKFDLCLFEKSFVIKKMILLAVNLQLTERSLQQELSCGIQSSPVLYPTPVRSWFRNGELVYTAFHGYPPDVSDFIMKHTILMPGVLDPVVFIATSSGSITFDTHVVNISQPMAIPSVTTVEGAREQVFNLLIGNWTCVVTNELGTDSVTHTFTSCSELTRININVCFNQYS